MKRFKLTSDKIVKIQVKTHVKNQCKFVCKTIQLKQNMKINYFKNRELKIKYFKNKNLGKSSN